MPYIGVSPSNGVRQKHTYTATASQTTFSGAGSEGISLSYKDSNYVDVYRNGVKLGDADYTATSGTSVVLGEGAAVSDIIEIVTYDVFSVADTVSKADGGVFDGNVTMAGTLAVTGETTLSANLNLGDNDKAIFGAGSGDLEIYSDGTYSRIMETGGLFLVVDTNGSQISLTADNSKNMGSFIRDGAVQLYFSNAQKFSTTSTGIDVTGSITATSFSGDGSALTNVSGPTALNAVGTYAFMYVNSVTNPGGTRSQGAHILRYAANNAATTSTIVPSGTWRVMGWLQSDQRATVMVRIA